LSINTIVAALALETDRDPVAGRALQLARQHGARLVFVHVIEDAISHEDLPVSLDTAAMRAIMERDATERVGQLLRDSGGEVTAKVVVEIGKPYQLINEIVERESAALIVIGPGKAKNIREKVLGSTADRIVRSSSQPVLVVRSPTPDPYRHLVVAVDFSAASQAAAKAAMQLVPDAAVELVHAMEIPLAFEQAMLKAGTPRTEINRHRRARAREARKQISASLKDISFGNAGLRIIQGDAAQSLVRLSRKGRTDLVVLGTQGGYAITQALLGSVAHHVLRAAGCDVLVST
jgi:nucleotide-binding universal stress UspA family protein